ncbi:beta-agarase [Mariniblastus sp.]|nr:beta-agarase [Mariniblastus sp.]
MNNLKLIFSITLASCLLGHSANGQNPTNQSIRAQSQVKISIDPFSIRSIQGTSRLNREAYFGICDPGTEFKKRCLKPTRYQWLIENNGITFGRTLQVVNGLDEYQKAIRQDPSRPEFVDKAFLIKKVKSKSSSADFKRDMNNRLDIAAHGFRNAFPEFMGIYQTDAARKDKYAQRLPKNIEAAAELSALALNHRFTDFDRPKYYEPINEPHWSYFKSKHLANWHLATMKTVHRDVPGVLVGGPCLAVPIWEKNLKPFIDNTQCKLDFYSFHIYDFLREKDGNFGGVIQSGLPLESLLDQIQNYTVNSYGKEVDIVVSEHGGYGANELVQKLAIDAQFKETGFEWEMKKRSIDDFNMVSSAIANTLVFMDHPHTVLKAVPFILLESMNWDPKYYATLYTARNFTDKADWLPGKKILFYRLFRDLRGNRIASSCPDPDIQTRAFVDGDTAFVILNNLSDANKFVSINLPRPIEMQVRRLGRNADFTPYLAEAKRPVGGKTAENDLDKNASYDFRFKGRETILIKSTYPKAIEPRRQIDEIPCYANRLDVNLNQGRKRAFTVEIPGKGKLEYASLRIGVNRAPEFDKEIAVTINGKPYQVPLEKCANRLTDKAYKSCKIIPLDPADVKTRNVIYVSFPDGQPGSISNVVIRAGFSYPKD